EPRTQWSGCVDCVSWRRKSVPRVNLHSLDLIGRMSRRSWARRLAMRTVRLLTLVLLLVLPATLQASILVVTSGQTVRYVGEPLPANVPADDALPPGFSVGYRHNSFSLFWVDFWTWNGSFCLYGG